MPRNASGVYTLPVAAFSPGGVIKASDHNSNYSDIGSAITESLATTGVSSMTGPMKAAAGSAAAPSYAFASDTTTGFYLVGSHQIGWTAGGSAKGTFNSDGSLTFSGALTAASFVGDVTGDLAGTHTGASVINTSLTLNATTISYGSGAMTALKTSIDGSQDVTASAASLAIDVNSGFIINLALNTTVTSFSLSNWPSSGKSARLILDITNGGANNITGWPGTTRWAGGSAPTITSGASKRDTIVLESNDGGANFRGYVVAQNMS